MGTNEEDSAKGDLRPVGSLVNEGAPRPRRQSPFLSIAGSSRSAQSEVIKDLSLHRGSVSLSDYKTLVSRSISRVALFEFGSDISVNFRPDEILNRIFSQNSTCLEANLTFASAMGLAAPSECLQRSFVSFFEPNQSMLELMTRWIEGNFFLSNETHRTTTPAGKDLVLQVSIYPVFEESFIRRFWYVARDVTELSRAVDSLQAAEEHYRTLVERPSLVLVRARPDGTYLYLSPHVEDIIGYSREDFERIPGLFQRLLHPEDVARHAVIPETRRLRSRKTVETEYRVRRKDGSYHWLFERMTPKLDESGDVEYYDSIAFDIQERKLLEAELVHAQRMETIGTLAGGIAHDFNNHLTAVLGQLTLCLVDLGAEHPCYGKLAAAEQAALCCAEMTKQLLSLGRKSDSELKPLHPGKLVEDSARLLSHILPSNIEVNLHCDSEARAVNGNHAQLQQVLMNLLINSRDAMPNGGRIDVSIREVVLGEKREANEYPQTPAGTYVEIAVTDCGEGIPEVCLPHIFEPFFTTKPPGEGTGLGLSMVYSIITAHQGAIHVASERGIGTTMSFILPALNIVPEETTQPELRDLPRGQECILVVEDDELVRSMVTTALCMGGYSVITANDGEEGLQQFIEHQDHIDMVMIDQTMPKRSGRELIREIQEIDRDMRIIFTSGFGTHEEDFIPPGSTNVAFVGKPYSLPDLLQKVRDLLEPPE